MSWSAGGTNAMSPFVGSIYNMGVWHKGAVAWVNIGTIHKWAGEVAACLRYREMGCTLENGGGKGVIVVERGAVLGFPMHHPLLHGHWPRASCLQ